MENSTAASYGTAAFTASRGFRPLQASARQRSQLQNREAARRRLAEILAAALAPSPPKRRPTKATRGAVERRLADKKGRARTKQLRRPADED